MPDKNKVVVRIAGKDYTLVGIESDEYIQKVGLYIDRKMNEITRSNTKLSTSLAAVLTAINVADDFFKAHDSELHLKKELKHAVDDCEKLKAEIKKLSDENAGLSAKKTEIQLDLAKREAELAEVRSTLAKSGK